MTTPEEFLEDFDPQIKEVGYDNYTYTPQQVIDRLNAYRKELLKEADFLPCLSDREKAYAFLSWRDSQKVVNIGGQKLYDVKGCHVYLNDEQLYDHWKQNNHN